MVRPGTPMTERLLFVFDFQKLEWDLSCTSGSLTANDFGYNKVGNREAMAWNADRGHDCCMQSNLSHRYHFHLSSSHSKKYRECL